MKQYLLLTILLIPFVFAAAPPSAAFPKVTLFFDKLNPEEMQIKPIENNEIRITSIGLTTKEEAFRSRIIVQAMPDCPENAPYQIDLLQCFFTSSQNLNDKIKQLEIRFKVPREWTEINGFSRIELRRYSYSWNENGLLAEWESLETKLEKQDENHIYYVAYSDGTDYFSIVGMKTGTNEAYVKETKPVEKIKEETTEKTELESEAHSQKQNTPLITGSATVEDPTPTNNPMGFALLVVFLTATLISVPIMKREESDFVKLVNYLEAHHSRDHAIEKLMDAGWENWQIDLALKEIKERE